MKSETKAVIASIVVLALALTAVSGVTYSWFSDTEKADIDVSTAVVKYESTFASSSGIGGDATSGFVLKNIAANLSESITVNMTNHSTIDTVYRVYVSYSLAAGATIGDYDLQNILINGNPLFSVAKDTGKIVVKNWTSVVKPDAESASVGSVTIPITTPSTYGDGADMSTARSGLTIKVVVEVYQGDYDMPTSAPISGGTATISEMDIGTTGEKASVTVTNLPADAGSNLNASVAKDSADMYVISASVDGKSDFGSPVTVTLVIPGDHRGSNVVYLGTTGEQPVVSSKTYDDTNKTTTIEFTTTHFSEFAVAKDVVAIADTADGVGVFDSLNEAFEEVVSGGYVVLVSDAEIDATVVVDNVATLNLNDKKIFNSVDLWNEAINSWSLVSVRGGDLTILGSGTLQAKEDDCYAVDLQDDGKCTIKNGTFVGNIHSVYVNTGDLTVEGGTFSVQQTDSVAGMEYEFVLNCYDEYYRNGTATITVSGGSFEKFNPMNCKAEGKNTNFLAEGYVVLKGEGDIYTVYDITKVEGNVFDGENAYTTMEKALDGIHVTGKNVLWCKPGADLGELSHGHICKDLTIYGNGASLLKGDFAIDYGPNKYGVTHYLTSDITLTIFSLNHVSVWGSRNTDYTVNINIYQYFPKFVDYRRRSPVLARSSWAPLRR